MGKLNTREAAKFLFGPSGRPGTLEMWRYYKKGPRYIKVGRPIRYDEQDLKDWLNSRIQETA